MLSLLPPSEPEKLKALFPSLELEGRLSHGIEETWVGLDNDLGKRVTLKVYRFPDSESWFGLDDFRQDVEVLAKLENPALPKVYKYRTYKHEPEKAYLILEQFEGESLAYWKIRDESELRAIAESLGLIVYDLHNAKPALIHRNIRPAHVIESKDGLRLIEFGLAYAVSPRTEAAELFWAQLQDEGHYLDPCMHLHNTRFKSDIYGIGLTLVFLATGCSPAEMETSTGAIDWKSHMQMKISAELQSWISRCIELDPENRFEDISHALAALKGHWNDDLVPVFTQGFLEVNTTSGALLIKNKAPNLDWIIRSPRTSSLSGQLKLYLFIGLFALAVATILEVSLLGGVLALGLVTLGFAAWIRSIFTKVEVCIDARGWQVKVTGQTVRSGELSELTGVYAHRTEGFPKLALDLMESPSVITRAEVDEKELESINELIHQFKKSQR